MTIFYGTVDNDNMLGGSGDDLMFGFSGNDWMNGGAGVDTMFGGLGDDTYVVNTYGDTPSEYAGEGTDRVNCYLVNYDLAANVEQLWFIGATTGVTGSGNDGNNKIVGGGYNDNLSAGAGDDIVIGGAGDDLMDGGAGHDTFGFLAGYGVDTISDFTAIAGANHDMLDVRAFGITAANFVDSVNISQIGGGTTMVQFGGGTVYLQHVNSVDVTIADFYTA